MPNAYLINEMLGAEELARVRQRLGIVNFDLVEWPHESIGAASLTDDVAVFVVTSSVSTAEEERRTIDAVNCNVRVILIYIDDSVVPPSSIGNYSFSRVGIESVDLGETLNGTKSSQESPTGEEAPVIKIKHNKC